MNIAANATEPADDIPARFRIPEHRDVFKGELAEHGDWIVANISTSSFWPITSQKVRWRGADVWIIPITKGFYPAVAINVPPGTSRAACEELVRRFLSTLSWVEECGFTVEYGGLSGGNLPRPMGRDKEFGFLIRDAFDLSYFPEVTDRRTLLALALMREGRGLNHVGYAFLSFYRILEVAFPKATKRIIAWIAASIDSLTDLDVKEALDGIRAQGVMTPDEIGIHLYRSGRCAMAHGAHEPIIDPDEPGELRRLGSELPIMRALAVKAIEEVFGVETSGTNWRKHLYELAGFKKILGPDIVAHMQKGTAPEGQPMLEIPDISIRLYRKDTYEPLEGLRCRRVGWNEKRVYMIFASLQGDVRFRFALDFDAERIVFNLFEDIGCGDTGTATSAERVHEVKRFFYEYFCNGRLHIINTDTGELIGRKDAYLPENIMCDDRCVAAEMAEWKALAEERRERDRKFAEGMERMARGYHVKVTLGNSG